MVEHKINRIEPRRGDTMVEGRRNYVIHKKRRRHSLRRVKKIQLFGWHPSVFLYHVLNYVIHTPNCVMHSLRSRRTFTSWSINCAGHPTRASSHHIFCNAKNQNYDPEISTHYAIHSFPAIGHSAFHLLAGPKKKSRQIVKRHHETTSSSHSISSLSQSHTQSIPNIRRHQQ